MGKQSDVNRGGNGSPRHRTRIAHEKRGHFPQPPGVARLVEVRAPDEDGKAHLSRFPRVLGASITTSVANGASALPGNAGAVGCGAVARSSQPNASSSSSGQDERSKSALQACVCREESGAGQCRQARGRRARACQAGKSGFKRTLLRSETRREPLERRGAHPVGSRASSCPPAQRPAAARFPRIGEP